MTLKNLLELFVENIEIAFNYNSRLFLFHKKSQLENSATRSNLIDCEIKKYCITDNTLYIFM